MCNGKSQIPKKEKPLSKILGIYYNYDYFLLGTL